MQINKVVRLFVLIVETLFFGIGFILGWNHFVPILLKQGFFRDGCPADLDDDAPCSDQDEKLDTLYLLSVQGIFMSVVMGAVMDRKGVLFSRNLSMVLITLGYLLLSVAGFNVHQAVYFALPVLCLAGFGSFLVNLRDAFTEIGASAAVLGAICGAFLSSGASVLVVKSFFFTIEQNLAWISALTMIFYNFLVIVRQLAKRLAKAAQADDDADAGSGEKPAVNVDPVEVPEAGISKTTLVAIALHFGAVQFALIVFSNDYLKLSAGNGNETSLMTQYSEMFGVLYGVAVGAVADFALARTETAGRTFLVASILMDAYVLAMPFLAMLNGSHWTVCMVILPDVVRTALFTLTASHILMVGDLKKFGTSFGSIITSGAVVSFLFQFLVRMWSVQPEVDNRLVLGGVFAFTLCCSVGHAVAFFVSIGRRRVTCSSSV